jgi:hypothetical protein
VFACTLGEPDDGHTAANNTIQANRFIRMMMQREVFKPRLCRAEIGIN